MVSRYPIAGELVSLRDTMDRLMADAFGSSPFRSFWPTANGSARMTLPLDVYATNDEVVIIAAVPGIEPDDLEVTVNKGTVTLSGATPNVAASEEAKEANWYLHELPHGAFTRSVTLPVEIDADKAQATFEHGVLRLSLPKAETAKPRKIKISESKPDAIEPGGKAES
jgi:HSP20 family protein